jgi:hypothetical protein
MKTEFDFLDSPLCTWARLVLAEAKLDYEKFPSGEYFYQILKRSDPRLQNSNSNLPNEFCPPPAPLHTPAPSNSHSSSIKHFTSNNNPSASSTNINSNFESNHYDTTYRSRLLNLDFILRNIRSFYQEVLNHILLIKLPDIYQIAKHPDSEETYKEMEKMLLLLMGLAINGEFKAKFIEQIQQQLETQAQMQLIPFIQLVTEDLSFSIGRTLSNKLFIQSAHTNSHNDTNEGQETLGFFINNKLMPNIQRVIDERDSYLESIIELEQDKDYLLFKLNNTGNANQCNNINVACNSANNNSISQDKEVNSVGCSQSAATAGQSILANNNNNSNSNTSNSDLKHLSINELILNLVNNSNTICKLETSSPANLVNDSLLNETNIISKLIDSIINKEIINEENAIGSMSHQNDSVNNDDSSSGSSSQNTSSANLMVRNSNDNHMHILNDLKNRKSLTNNWNQKIAIELVECKIRLKQLINEM